MVELIKSSYEKHVQFAVDNKKDQELHIHDCLEIVFVLTGTVTVEINSDIIQVKQEGLFVVNIYEVHRVIYGPGAHTLSLFLGKDVLGDKFLPIYCELEGFGQPSKIWELKQGIARMFRLFYKAPEQNREEIFSCAYRILGTLQNYFVDETAQKISPGQNFDRVGQILRYINENYAQPLTLTEVSARFYMSAGHISRMFRSLVKMSFHQYVREVRLHHAYLELKTDSCSVTQIAYDCGFGTANLMIDAFRQKYGMTPGKLRKKLQQENMAFQAKDPDMFRHLMKHVGDEAETGELPLPVESVNIKADVRDRGYEIQSRFFELLNIGWARDLLMEPIQEQIRLCQRRIGFRYLRCHGVFDDDMMVYHQDSEGNASYNFTYVDKVYDFLSEVGLRPYVELSYIPSQLSASEGQWYYKKSHICMPASMERWRRLVQSFVRHCMARYGREFVRTWRFTLMSSLHAYYKNYSMEDYLLLYRETYRAVKEIDPELMFGGPGTELSLCLMEDGQPIERYLEFYTSHGCMPDFFSFQFFHIIYDRDYRKALSLVRVHEHEPMPITEDPDFLAHTLEKMEAVMKQYKLQNREVVLECWNSTIWQRDLCNDTCYKSAFLFKNLLDNLERPVTIGYWTMSDMMEELFADEKLFHGGYGMLTRSGIPKSIFLAYSLLRKLGSQVLQRGEGYVVTKKTDGSIQAAFYNYCHYDSLSRQNFFTEGSNTQRYKIFQRESKREYRLHVRLEPGEYTVERYSISRHRGCGSAYDNWVNMGAPEPVNGEQEKYLRSMSEPHYYYEKKEIQHGLLLRELVDPHEVRILEIQRIPY